MVANLKTKKHILLLLVLLLAALLRLYMLGEIPLGITHDELGYVYNAYSIAKTGSNVFSEKLPLLTWMVKGGFPFLPVPIYLAAPFYFFLPLSVETGRLPAALLSIVDVFLIYLIVKKLFQKESLAIVSSFFLAISPWHLHFSRSAYDPNFALFFYLVAIAFFLFESEKKKLPLLSSVSFLLAILSYRGMNAVFLPLALLLLWYVARTYKLTRRQILTQGIGIVGVVFCFSLLVLTFGKSYTQEALFFNDPKAQESVDKESREAQGPLWIKRLFLNKPTYLAAKLRENYLGVYSPEFLFLHTEPHKIYSIWSRGRVYFLDALFIFLGILYLLRVQKNAGKVIIFCVLIGGLPGLLGGMPYSARTFFISGFLPVLTAGGVLAAAELTKNRLFRYGILFCIVFGYIYSFGSYLFDYYDRYAPQAAESWAKSLKDLSFVVASEKSKNQEIIISNTSFGDVVQYALYTHAEPKIVQNAWLTRKLNSEGREVFLLDNITFKPDCEILSKQQLTVSPEQSSKLLIVRDSCNKAFPSDDKIQDYFGNTVWKMYSLTY